MGPTELRAKELERNKEVSVASLSSHLNHKHRSWPFINSRALSVTSALLSSALVNAWPSALPRGSSTESQACSEADR